MVIPFTSSVAREVLKAVPATQREAAYALGATRWEAIRAALRFGRTGIIGAVMLGFGRALGETMAVTMVIGNNPQVSASLFAPQYTMAAVIANEFTEAADDSLPERPDRDRARALRHHPRHQRALAPADLERHPRGQGQGGAGPGADRACPGGRGMSRLRRRRLLSGFVVVLCGAAVVVALVPLAFVFFYVIKQGFSSLNWDFFTKMPKPVGEAGGGMANAIVGTLILIGIASAPSRSRSACSPASISRSIPGGGSRRSCASPPTS